MFGRVVLVHADLGIRALFRRIEQSEFEARPQRVRQGLVDFLFGDQPFFDGSDQGVVISAAAEIATGLDRAGSGFFRGVHVMMLLTTPNVVDGAAVGNDITLKAPLLAQKIGEQKGTGASGKAVDGIVSAHDPAHVSFAHRHLEVR